MKLLASLIAVVLALPGCSDSTKTPRSSSGARDGASTVKPAPIVELTTEQVESIEALAKAYTAAISDNDIAGAWSHWDTDAFWKLAMTGLAISETEKEKQKAESIREIGHGFVGGLSESRYHFRHTRVVDGEARFLCRMLAGSEGINYHDHIVRFDAEGNPKIVDIYVYLSGERFSDSIRNTSAMILSKKSKPPPAKLLGSGDGNAKHIDNVQKVISLTRKGMHSQAIQLFESLPEEYRRNKVAHLVYLQACMALATEENASAPSKQRYLNAITSYKTTHPGDPSLALISLDYWFLTESWEELIASVEQLDVSVGPDSNNLFFLSFANRKLGRPEEALKHADEAIKEEPDLEESWHAVLESTLMAEDFDRAAESLDKLEENFHYSFSLNSMQSEQIYEKFLASDAGKAWAGEHPE
jgi:tetratricopeptide (TPR) repeat protein